MTTINPTSSTYSAPASASLLRRLYEKHILHIFRVVGVVLFLCAFISWASEFWLNRTEQLSQISLIAAALLELLAVIRPFWRRFSQFVVIAGIQLFYIQWGIVREAPAMWHELGQQLASLHPYIWFGFGTWLAFLGGMVWFQTRMHTFVLVLVAILSFAVVDSFSPVYYWDEVAMIVLSGFLLMVVCHFEQFKLKHPASWSYFSEYPTAFFVPIGAIISFVMLIGIIMPSIPSLVPDPYTLWKSMKGDAVSAFGKKSDGKNLTGIAKKSGETLSGYRRNDERLGGGFEFDNTPIMKVDTSRKSYWRGESKSYYTGQGWTDSVSDKRLQIGPAQFGSLLEKDGMLPSGSMTKEEVTQTVTMLEDDPNYPVLFGALSMTKVELNGDGTAAQSANGGLLWNARLSQMYWLRDSRDAKAAYPRAYTVTSEIPMIDEAGLRQVKSIAADDPALSDYLQLPDRLPKRVRDLALEWTNQDANVYDKVKSIEKHLQEDYEYTNKPNTAIGKSKDFVDRFLFEIKEGYCDYFSTAMAVLTRSIGIPSRWVKGFTSGSLPQDRYMQNIPGNMPVSESGTYTVSNSNAHSWVEVYFPDWGWVPFEPTAGFSIPVIKAEKPVDEVVPDADGAEAAEKSGDRRTWGQRAQLPGAVLFAAAILAIVAWAILKRLGISPSMLARRSEKEQNRNQRIVAEFNKMLRRFKRKGYKRFEHETVREAGMRWTEQNRWLQKEFSVLARIFEKAKYGSSLITEEEAEKALLAVRRLSEQV